MIDPNPCHGCTERYTACHDHCERRAKWLEQYHGQQEHLKECRERWHIPITSARQKAYNNYYPDHRKYTRGGSE